LSDCTLQTHQEKELYQSALYLNSEGSGVRGSQSVAGVSPVEGTGVQGSVKED